MSNLPSKHRDLSSVVCIVGDQVSEKGSDIRSEPLDSPIGFQSSLQDCAESGATLLQALLRLDRRHRVPVKLIGNVAALCGSFQPHNAHVVDVGYDRSDLAPFALGRFGTPSLGRKIVDHVMINPIVDIESIEQRIGGYE